MINYIFTNSSCITKEIFFYEKKLKWHWFSIGVILGHINIHTSLSFNDEGSTIHKVLRYFRRLNEYRIFCSWVLPEKHDKLWAKIRFQQCKTILNTMNTIYILFLGHWCIRIPWKLKDFHSMQIFSTPFEFTFELVFIYIGYNSAWKLEDANLF